jgi:hypothetical protein
MTKARSQTLEKGRSETCEVGTSRCDVRGQGDGRRSAASLPFLRVLRVAPFLFVLIRVIRVKDPVLLRANPTYYDLIRPIQDPLPPALGPSCPAKPQAESSSFQKKKDCLFLAAPKVGWTGGLGSNQPKSTLSSRKANQMQTDANQKKRSPLDSSCERTVSRAETFNLQPITAPHPPHEPRVAQETSLFANLCQLMPTSPRRCIAILIAFISSVLAQIQ